MTGPVLLGALEINGPTIKRGDLYDLQFQPVASGHLAMRGTQVRLRKSL